MRLRAIYVDDRFNPFLPDLDEYLKQFRQIETDELPEDVDMAEMEVFARQRIEFLDALYPLRKHVFLKLEKLHTPLPDAYKKHFIPPHYQ
jgi:hypothetical protein